MNRDARGQVIRALTGAAIILLASVGSVLAADISIGGTKSATEFGQGEFTLKVCDSWIQLDLVSGSTGQNGAPEGLSALTGITIQGLDASQCKSTQFTIQAIDLNLDPLPLYRTDGKSVLCNSMSCAIGVSAESDIVVLVNPSGMVTLPTTNPYLTLSFDDSLGIYKIAFSKPAQLARDITDVIIQSSTF